VQSYPTLLFVAAEEGAKPVSYDGEREASAIAKWVKANAKSLKWEGPSFTKHEKKTIDAKVCWPMAVIIEGG